MRKFNHKDKSARTIVDFDTELAKLKFKYTRCMFVAVNDDYSVIETLTHRIVPIKKITLFEKLLKIATLDFNQQIKDNFHKKEWSTGIEELLNLEKKSNQ